jgi:hypothetical protein
MKYKVNGTNRETGARMILEFEAPNRAMAERKATHAGMGEVLHCQEVADPNSLRVESHSHRGEFEPPRRRGTLVAALIGVILILAIIGFATWRRRH